MEKLVDEQGGVPVTVLQAAEAGWLHVVRRKLEKAVADDESVPEMLAGNESIETVCIYQSCMVYNYRLMICEQKKDGCKGSC